VAVAAGAEFGKLMGAVIAPSVAQIREGIRLTRGGIERLWAVNTAIATEANSG
jgi:hypothetical protein